MFRFDCLMIDDKDNIVFREYVTDWQVQLDNSFSQFPI